MHFLKASSCVGEKVYKTVKSHLNDQLKHLNSYSYNKYVQNNTNKRFSRQIFEYKRDRYSVFWHG